MPDQVLSIPTDPDYALNKGSLNNRSSSKSTKLAHKLNNAYLSMLCSELDSLQQAKGLIHTTANRQIVDGRLLQHPLRVDDEQATQSYSLVLD